jgi:hypothetical protein
MNHLGMLECDNILGSDHGTLHLDCEPGDRDNGNRERCPKNINNSPLNVNANSPKTGATGSVREKDPDRLK